MTFPDFANMDFNPSQCDCNCVNTDKSAWLKKAEATTKLDVVKSMENIDINPLYTKADLSDLIHPSFTAGITPNLCVNRFTIMKKICVLIVLMMCAGVNLNADELLRGNNKSWCFKDSLGNITAEYDEIRKLDGSSYWSFPTFIDRGLAKAFIEKKCGIIDSTGKIIIPILYDFIMEAYNNSFWIVEKDGKCGYLDEEGNELFGGLIYEFAGAFGPYGKGIAKVKKDGKEYCIDENGNIVDSCP
jgi:hypothetical protein